MEASAEQPQAGQPSLPRKKMTKQLTGKRDDTPLHTSARGGNLAAVTEVFSSTGDAELKELLEKQNQAGETALYVAAEYGYVDLVREMIKYYDLADASIKARNGFDAFHIAAKQGDLGMYSFKEFFVCLVYVEFVFFRREFEFYFALLQRY
jgi:ankyrin repeat protein